MYEPTYVYNLKTYKYDIEGEKVMYVDFFIHELCNTYRDGEEVAPEPDEHASLSGRVDWQDGITIWQSECIETHNFSRLMSAALVAIKDAQSLIDPELWKSGGQADPR